MEIKIQNLDEKWYEHRSFLIGYGKFPYIILKAGHATFMQIPIHFNTNGDFVNYPGTNIDDISDELLAEYQKDKTAKLHNRLLQHCQWVKNKIESENEIEQYNLGILHSKGDGITRDYSKAFEWYLKAAERGLAEAQHDVGVYYRDGIGVTKIL